MVAVELTENLTNSGLLYSNTSSHYRLDGTFTNRGRVVAETDLTIEGLTGARAGGTRQHFRPHRRGVR